MKFECSRSAVFSKGKAKRISTAGADLGAVCGSPIFGTRKELGRIYVAPRLRMANSMGTSALCLALMVICGCVSYPQPAGQRSRGFEFDKDTLAYPNELKWEYHYEANGKWTTHTREPKPTYALHCFVVARTVRQFFENCRFDPTARICDKATYRRLIRQVARSSARRPLPEEEKIVIPGYADLRAFSQQHERILKEECGGAWQSYVQRGHWRMIFPFTRHQQERMAKQLLAHVRGDWPVIVHVVRFPALTINHAIVIFEAKDAGEQLLFTAYDPNQVGQPLTLRYDRGTRRFSLPPSSYYPGGRVDVYEIFYKWDY